MSHIKYLVPYQNDIVNHEKGVTLHFGEAFNPHIILTVHTFWIRKMRTAKQIVIYMINQIWIYLIIIRSHVTGIDIPP